jgi:hypothetical protein
MNIVKIISTSFDELGRLLPKFQRMGLNDVQETVSSAPHGIDSNPVKDMIAIYSPTSVKGEAVVIGYLNKDCISDIGETRVFSTDENGELQTYIHLKNDGDIHFGGDTGNLTRFQELESGFNQLKSDFNSLVSAFNSHVHATAATGPPSPPTPVPSVIPAITSSASIVNAKIDEFKTL